MALPSAPDTTPAMDDDQQARPEDKKRERSEDPVEELPNAKRSKNSVTNSAAVQSHYDARPNMGHFEREHSPIIGLRRFNNWVKSVLIGSYVREGDIVLDICGGKGGDMPKWTHGRISHLVLHFRDARHLSLTHHSVDADLAPVSVEHALERYNETVGGHRCQFTAEFVAADCCKASLRPVLDRLEHTFDMVSCQFALHYSFESEERAHELLHNISHKLRNGGYFVATIPSAGWIVKKLQEVPGLTFGNDMYRIEFEKKEIPPPRFGAKYTFFLQDAVENVPEYLVHTETLIQIAHKFGLSFVQEDNLMGFYEKNKHSNMQLLKRMKVHDYQGRLSLSPSGQETASLYKVIVFRKTGPGPAPSKLQTGQPHILTTDSIIRVYDTEESDVAPPLSSSAGSS